MKMKLWDRLILRLGAIITLLAGLVSVAGGILLWNAQITPAKWWPAGNYAAIVLIATGVLTVLVSLYDIALPRRYNPRRRAFVTQPTEHGELRIAVSAIENLILRCVETHKEVKVLAMQISNRRGAVNVNLRVSVNSNISIPHAVEQLQTQIKRYLAASSGIEVREISVSVERATGDESALPSEPLPRAAVAEPEVHAEEKKEQVSVHQRVFGRDTSKSVAEQVAEAEVIEPPMEEPKEEEKAEAAEETVEAPAAEVAEEVAEEAVAEAVETVETVEEVAEATEEAVAEAETVAEEASQEADEEEAQA